MIDKPNTNVRNNPNTKFFAKVKIRSSANSVVKIGHGGRYGDAMAVGAVHDHDFWHIGLIWRFGQYQSKSVTNR